MGFLYQVLKDVSEKQPYSVGKTELKGFVENVLKPNLSTGREGFKVIAQVAERVRGYNDKVRESNEKVKRPIKKLQADLNNKFEEKVSAILPKQHENAPTEIGHAVSRAVSLVDECKSFARVFLSNMRKAEEDFKAISYLNDECESNVNNARENIFHEAAMLNRWSFKGKEWKDFKTVESLIQSTLTSLGNCVNTDITEKITAFVDELKKKTSAILKELQRIDKQLWESVLSLEDWIKRTKSDITFLQKDVDKILEEVKWGDRGEKSANRQNLEAAAMTLRGKAEELYQAGKAAKEKVAETVTSALAQVKKMDEALKGDLKKVKDAVQGKVEEIKTAIGKLHGVVTTGEAGGGKEAANQKIELIMKAISEKATHINSMVGENGLQRIARAVDVYATGFKSRFEQAITSMVDQIVDYNTVFAGYVNGFVEDNRATQSNKVNEYKVKGAFKNYFPSYIREIVKRCLSAVNLSVMPQLSELIEKLDKFGETFETFLKNTDVVEQTVHHAIGEITGDRGLKLNKQQPYNDSNLRSALKTIITAVHTAAKVVSLELQAFMKTSDFSQIKSVSDLAKQINDRLQKTLKMTATLTPTEGSAQAVDTAIDGVTAEVDKQLPKGKDDSHVKFPDDPIFKDYKAYVKQGSQGIEKDALTGNTNEGSLPAAIGEIKTAVEKTLEQVQKINEEADKKLREVNEETHRLCNSVRRAGRDVNRGLNDLIDGKIEEQLSKIKEQIKALHHTLESVVVVNTKKLLTYAENAGKQIMTQLTKHVNDIIKQATDKLTTTLRKNYVTSARDALTTFSAKIHSELVKLPAAIDRDSTIGFKGFLHKFSNTFLEEASRINNITTESRTGLKEAAEHLSKGFQRFSPILSLQDEVEPYAAELQSVFGSVDSLLRQIIRSMHFDHLVLSRLSASEIDFTSFTPETFSDAPKTSLWPLKMGFLGFNAELQKAYVSTYSRQDWDEEEQGKYAKVCLSIVPIVTNSLRELKQKVDQTDGKWKDYKVYNKQASRNSLHALFFRDNGYDTHLPVDAEHGELNHKAEFTARNIHTHLNDETHGLFNSPSTSAISSVRPNPDEPTFDFTDENGAIPKLYDYLKKYFHVCHFIHIPAPKSPCSVYQMLLWTCGLQFNPVYDKLKGHIGSLFMVEDKQNPPNKVAKPIDASPSQFDSGDIITVVEHICETSYALLTTFVGTGDEATYYACEFPNNSLGLQYPSNPADCLDTLLDILRRIFPPLKFLFMQCSNTSSENGWYKCLYGRDVKSNKWPCKEHSKSKSKCEAKCQPKCQPTCQPKCRPTSPLQSYLSDSLTGHLPHALTSIGCKAECNTCPKGKPGMPCITPLGFRAFSGSTKTGGYLCNIIGAFLDIDNIYSLFALSVKAPKTLPEHFDFAMYISRSVGAEKAIDSGKQTFGDAFTASIDSQSIYRYSDAYDLTKSFVHAYGSESAKHIDCKHTHLTSLTGAFTCKVKTQGTNCAPYLSPLCTGTYHHLVNKNSATYLSWILYLPWDFWNCLNNFYSDFCKIFCQDWGCRGCLRNDVCNSGSHGMLNPAEKGTGCQCPTVVDCKGVSPTLYQYGFSFQDAQALISSKRNCFNLRNQLYSVLQSQYFKDLFTECDKYLWIIRQPFSYLVLALWLLSLLYLIHIMVIRLDLLHIKSHLHSPSSHRIAAQSLLAASRVNKLNRVFYLQP